MSSAHRDQQLSGEDLQFLDDLLAIASGISEVALDGPAGERDNKIERHLAEIAVRHRELESLWPESAPMRRIGFSINEYLRKRVALHVNDRDAAGGTAS